MTTNHQTYNESAHFVQLVIKPAQRSSLRLILKPLKPHRPTAGSCSSNSCCLSKLCSNPQNLILTSGRNPKVSKDTKHVWVLEKWVQNEAADECSQTVKTWSLWFECFIQLSEELEQHDTRQTVYDTDWTTLKLLTVRVNGKLYIRL